jgi:hypothetical protein
MHARVPVAENPVCQKKQVKLGVIRMHTEAHPEQVVSQVQLR